MSKTLQLREKYAAINKQNGGVNYFERMQKLRETDPAQFDGNISSVHAQGSYNANVFLQAVTDYTHEQHLEAINIYSQQHSAKMENVHKHFIDIELFGNTVKRITEENSAIEQGKKAATDFIGRLKDFRNPGYAFDVIFFKTELNANPAEVEGYFLDKAYKAINLKRVPVRDLSYEASITKGYAPANEYEQTALDSLADFMKERFSAVGYEVSKADYETFLSESLPISGNPTFKPRK